MNQQMTLEPQNLSLPAFRWEVFSESHKVLLTSQAFFVDHAWWIFDPISIPDLSFESAVTQCCPGTTTDCPWNIVLTNGNHERAIEEFKIAQPSVKVHVTEGSELETLADTIWNPDPDITEASLGPWKRIRLHGGAPGETAYFLESIQGVVIGDALVNLPDREFEILPDKYCENPDQLRKSLKRMIQSWNIERLCTAHGNPIANGAGSAVERLLSF